MGCDIHAQIFVQDAYGGDYGEYWPMADIEISRDYTLFAAMASVRNYGRGIEPISEPRGIPPEIPTHKLSGWLQDTDDGHSHSWLGGSEFEDAIMRAGNRNNSAKAALEYMRVWFRMGKHVMIVFCFDN